MYYRRYRTRFVAIRGCPRRHHKCRFVSAIVRNGRCTIPISLGIPSGLSVRGALTDLPYYISRFCSIGGKYHRIWRCRAGARLSTHCALEFAFGANHHHIVIGWGPRCAALSNDNWRAALLWRHVFDDAVAIDRYVARSSWRLTFQKNSRSLILCQPPLAP